MKSLWEPKKFMLLPLHGTCPPPKQTNKKATHITSLKWGSWICEVCEKDSFFLFCLFLCNLIIILRQNCYVLWGDLWLGIPTEITAHITMPSPCVGTLLLTNDDNTLENISNFTNSNTPRYFKDQNPCMVIKCVAFPKNQYKRYMSVNRFL